MQSLIEMDDFANELERKNARVNLNCLKVYELQQEIRQQVLQNYMTNQIALDFYGQQTFGDLMYQRQLVDRNFYRRTKSYAQSKKEARTLDRFEQNMRSGQDNRKKNRHKEFLNEVLQHAKDFHEFHKKRYAQIKRKHHIFKNHIENKERKVTKEKNVEDQKRKQLLRENNFDDWLKLINFEKNERLMEILNQTNRYIEELGEKVCIQKHEVDKLRKGNSLKKDDMGDEESDEEGNQGIEEKKEDELDQMDENEKIKYNLKNSSKVYYKITHSIQDEVKEQPKMLKGGDLKNYQIYGLNWMVSLYNNNLNGILADEMGLGKTIQTISLFSHLIEVKGNEGPFLIVVPLTTISNWTFEFDRWAPDIKKIIYKGKKSERPRLAQTLKSEKFNVLITTYEYIMIDKAILSKVLWQYIIVDEGHRMKNNKSKFALTLG